MASITLPYSRGQFPSLPQPTQYNPAPFVIVRADPTGVADCSKAIQDAVDAVLAFGGEGTIYFPPGEYRVLKSINLTKAGSSAGEVGITVAGAGPRATLISAITAGLPLFDCTGRAFITFRDFAVSGNQSLPPSTAFLLARNTSNDSAGLHRFYNVHTLGFFSTAALYGYASEELLFEGCIFTNSSIGACSVQLTNNNIQALTSPFVPIAVGAISTTVFKFIECAISNFAAIGTNDSLRLNGVGSLSFTGGFMANTAARSFVRVDASTEFSNNIAIRDSMIDGGNTDNGLLVSGPTEVTRVTLDNIYDVGVRAGGFMAFGEDGTNISSLQIRNVWSTSSLAYRFYQVSNGNLELGPLDTLHLTFACPNNIIRVDTSKLTIDRMDFSSGNVVFPSNSTPLVAIASAATIALPLGHDVVSITGAVNIATITADGHCGRRVTLVFAGAPTVVDGSNLKLSANFVASADDTLTLASDGVNWYEVSRSAN